MKYFNTFALMRSNCLFWASISFPMSIAIDFRLPTMFATCLFINKITNETLKRKKKLANTFANRPILQRSLVLLAELM